MQNLTKQLPHKSDSKKFVAGLTLIHYLKHLADQFTAASTFFKKRINKCISIKKVAVLSVKQCAAAFHKAAGVKYETLIDAVIRNTAMDGSGRNDGSITLM